MSKQKLFLDFDNTMTASISAFCNAYNILYLDHPDFVPARPAYVEKWNFADECPLLEGRKDLVHDIFEHGLFFKYLYLMDNARDVIERACNKYQVIVCSIGTPLNIAKKAIWLRDNLPCIKDYVLLVNNGNQMNKSVVNMEGAIFCDDVLSNLESSNAETKIIFGDEYTWNVGSSLPRAWNWVDLDRMLL